MSLTASDILGAKDFETKKLTIKEWGGEVYIRTLSARSRDFIEQATLDKAVIGGRALLMSLSLCDENGELLFKKEDADALEKKDGRTCDRILLEIQNLNSWGEKDLDELEKKS
jgi:hypothetical protein